MYGKVYRGASVAAVCTSESYCEGAGPWTTTTITRGEDHPEEKDWERMLDCLWDYSNYLNVSLHTSTP
jgi:hypothetical protein